MATELDLELELEAQELDLCEQVEAYFKSLKSEDVIENEKVISNF